MQSQLDLIIFISAEFVWDAERREGVGMFDLLFTKVHKYISSSDWK